MKHVESIHAVFKKISPLKIFPNSLVEKPLLSPHNSLLNLHYITGTVSHLSESYFLLDEVSLLGTSAFVTLLETGRFY